MRIQGAIRRAAQFIGVAVLLSLGVVSQSSAGTITITYQGSVQWGLDSTGVFGTAGADLTGTDYKLVFTVDPAAGSYLAFHGAIGDPLLSGDNIFGGISAALTIDGRKYMFAGGPSSDRGYDAIGTKPGFGEFGQGFSDTFSGVSTYLSSTNPGPGFPTSVYTTFTLSNCPTASCSFAGTFGISTGSDLATGRLNFGSVTVSTTPIPATLPLLISALGGLGLAGWRRGKLAAA